MGKVTDQQGSFGRFPLYSEQKSQNSKCLILHRVFKGKKNKTPPPSFSLSIVFPISLFFFFLCMQESIKQGRALLCCPAGVHPPLSWSLSTRYPRKAWSICFIDVSVVHLTQTKSVKMSNTNPFHHLASFSGVSSLARWRTTEEVIITCYCF